MFLLVAEYLPTEDADGNPIEKRHIVSVFKLVQELLAPSRVKGKNQFQLLLEKLPPNHKARWFAGSALNTAEQAMASVMDSEQPQGGGTSAGGMAQGIQAAPDSRKTVFRP